MATITSHLLPASPTSARTSITPASDISGGNSNIEMSLDSSNDNISNHSTTLVPPATVTNVGHLSQFSVAKLINRSDDIDEDDDDGDDNESLNPKIDNSSCCSEDTVLSVGNENPVQITSGSDNDLTSSSPHRSQPLSFKNIQNHLNAISQITNSLTTNCTSPISPPSVSPNFIISSPTSCEPTLSSPNSSSGTNRSCTSSPCSPSSYTTNGTSSSYSRHSRGSLTPGKITPDHIETSHQNHHHNNNNNINNNNNNLKFSIDNILKADFGRRITDPLTIKKGHRLNNTHSKKLTNAVNALSLTKNAAAISLPNASYHTCSSISDRQNPVDLSKSDNSSTSTAVSLLQQQTNTLLTNGASVTTGSSSLLVDKTDSISCKTNSVINSTGTSSSSSSSAGASSAAAATATSATSSTTSTTGGSQPMLWPAWVYCTRYSDRPSSGRSKYRRRIPKSIEKDDSTLDMTDDCSPRSRRTKKPNGTSPSGSNGASSAEEKRPRTAFSGAQLARLKHEFAENRYLTERRRQQLSAELGLNEAQIKIWFQNKRAKIKKASGHKNPLALQLMAQGLYNHSTVPLTREEEELQQQSNSQ